LNQSTVSDQGVEEADGFFGTLMISAEEPGLTNGCQEQSFEAFAFFTLIVESGQVVLVIEVHRIRRKKVCPERARERERKRATLALE
jgi:hypothetical protein